MKTQTLLKTITVAGALAATLTLSACDMHISFGQEGQGQEQDGQRAQGQQTENSSETTVGDQTTDTGSTSDSATDGAGSTGTTNNGTADNGSGGSSDSSSSSSASDSSTSSRSSSNGSASTGSSSSSDTTDGYQGPRIGEEGVELDADGNGKIPADVLEKDIEHAYAKQGTTVDTVDCYSDLRIYSHSGSQSYTVTAAGKNHYGTVKITSASQSGIGYSLEFPNI